MKKDDFISFKITKFLHKHLTEFFPNTQLVAKEIKVEHPKELEHGDYASNIPLVLGRKLQKNPFEIAQNAANFLNRKLPKYILQIQAVSPGFLNILLEQKFYFENLDLILNLGNSFGKSNFVENKKWLIEHTSPNPNKAMHLGHLRNNITGMAIANLWEEMGIRVIRDCIDNNRGIAIAKLMWGYLKFARKNKNVPIDINYWYANPKNWQTPKDLQIRPDRFVDNLYTMAAKDCEENEESETTVRQMVVDWENNDKKNRFLWKKILSYSYQGQNLTLKRLGNVWNKVWHEHNHYKKGKEFVASGLKNNVFRKTSEGTILTKLEKYHLPDTVVKKSDGTSLYITQDLALTNLKRKTFKPNRLHWVIGPEQSLALKQMFAVCEQLKIGKLSDFVHIAYGYMSIKGKGKMSSRTGNVVYIDDLLDTAKNKIITLMKSAKFVKLNEEKNAKLFQQTAQQLAIGAVKYSILKVGRLQNIAFDYEESVDLNGNSGPYLQYSHARAKSILAKNTQKKTNSANPDKSNNQHVELKGEEETLLRLLYRFPEIVVAAGENNAPNLICNYLFDLAQKYNTLYDKLPILKAEENKRVLRIKLTAAFAQVVKNGLRLLGIDAPEKM